MKGLRRCVYFSLLLLVFGFFIGRNESFAEEVFPQKPIQIIAPVAAGGPQDIQTRAVADRLAKTLGKQVLVINKPGGGGIEGAEEVIRSKKDGYTLISCTAGQHHIMPLMYPKEVTYNSMEDLEPLAHSHVQFLDIVVRADSPLNNFEDLVKYTKANPGKLNIGISGIGSQPHVIYQILKDKGIDMNLILTKGAPESMSFLLGGHVDALIFLPLLDAKYVKEGKWKYLIFLSNNRVPEFPNIPTIAEKGWSTTGMVWWMGFFAPTGTPQNILNILKSAFKETLTDPAFVAEQAKLWVTIEWKSADEAKKMIRDERIVYRDLLTKMKLTQ